MGRPSTHIYVIEGDDRVKVGRSHDPKLRLKAIVGGKQLLHTTEVLFECDQVEKTAHRLLAMAGKHIRCEWFRASLKDAVEAIERAKRIVAGEELPLDRVSKPVHEMLHVRLDARSMEILTEIRRNDPRIPSVPTVIRELIMRAKMQQQA